MTELILTNITLHQKRKLLDVTFNDGTQYLLSCEYLRVFTPARKKKEDFIHGKENVNINEIVPVGQYAVNLVFDDGYNEGLYSWQTLYDLGQHYQKNWAHYQAQLGNPPIEHEQKSVRRTASFRIKIIYFASLIEQLKREQEDLLAPRSANTVEKLLDYLRKRGKIWHNALDHTWVTVTINKKFASMETPLEENDEIAIVPVWRQ